MTILFLKEKSIMENAKIAGQLAELFDQKITAFYKASYNGKLGKLQIELLEFLYEHESAKGLEIAEALNIPKQYASKIILKFEEKGWIDAKQDVDDKRAKQFYLTKEGRQYVEAHIAESNAHFEELLNRLSQSEQNEMINAMQTMVEILKKM